jgi:hypothetical protein
VGAADDIKRKDGTGDLQLEDGMLCQGP